LPNQFNRAVVALAQSVLPSEKDADRRTEIRYPAQDPAELEIMPGPTQPMFGTILDVSRSGLRVALSRRIDRGVQVKVKLHNNDIFGEVRYCRAVSGVFHVGIRIKDLVRPANCENQHIADDPLSLYAVGKGLSIPEVVEIREHLGRCKTCRARLGEKDALLNPSRRAIRAFDASDSDSEPRA
jgi:hypothetical protein